MDDDLAVVEVLTRVTNLLRVSVATLEPSVVMTKNPEQVWQREPEKSS